MTQKERMYAEITAHGSNLNRIFETGLESVRLCKILRRIENRAHQNALRLCNGNMTVEEYEKEEKVTENSLNAVLDYRAKGIPVFVNSDARGYALKIDDQYIKQHNIIIYTDFGGYGIIAPDFSNK